MRWRDSFHQTPKQLAGLHLLEVDLLRLCTVALLCSQTVSVILISFFLNAFRTFNLFHGLLSAQLHFHFASQWMSELSHHEPNVLSRKFTQFDLDGKSLFRNQTNYLWRMHVEIEVADNLVTATSAGPCATLCRVPLVPSLY